MIFAETPLKGAYLIEIEEKTDDRGFFARAFCQKEFSSYGLKNRFVQINNSLSFREKTLRGMHYQLSPNSETKIIRCIRGSFYDVILDLRPNSETFGKFFSLEMTADNRKMLYIPEGFAHGFLTLEDNTEALYLVSEFYTPGLERGVRWDDPKFNIKWPFAPEIISEKDRNHPDFNPRYHLGVEQVVES